MPPEITPNTQIPQTDPAIELIQASEPVSEPTAQTPVSEPLKSEPEPIATESKPVVQEVKPEPAPQQTQTITQPESKPSLAHELLTKARNAIQFRKRKKLDRIMNLFTTKQKITNDEIEKFLYTSDATATRYLSELEKEEKIKQEGKTGKGVTYSQNK